MNLEHLLQVELNKDDGTLMDLVLGVSDEGHVRPS